MSEWDARTEWVYLLANHKGGTLYVGSTSELLLRLYEHRTGRGSKFVWKHEIFRLVWFEAVAGKAAALAREHAIKRWRREWKFELIEAMNPNWMDLTEEASGVVGQEYRS